jgi:hypothetical protein
MEKIIHECDCCGNNIDQDTYTNYINFSKEVKIGNLKFKITVEQIITKEEFDEDVCISCLQDYINNIQLDDILQNTLMSN